MRTCEFGFDGDADNLTPAELNSHLTSFYAAARKEDCELCKLNSMRSLRFSIHRHFLSAQKINIIDDAEFSSANILFYNMLNLIKTNGKGDTEVRKLYWSFDIKNQYGLQEKVWFDIQLYLIRRGREGLRSMTKKTFGVFVDATGRK